MKNLFIDTFVSIIVCLDSKDSRFSAMYKMRGSRLSIVLSGNNLFEEKEIRLFSWIFIHKLSLILFLLYLSIKYYFFAWKIIYKTIVTNLCVRLLWYFIFPRYAGWICVHIYILILCISPHEKHWWKSTLAWAYLASME